MKTIKTSKMSPGLVATCHASVRHAMRALPLHCV